jgi:hypothetical protein
MRGRAEPCCCGEIIVVGDPTADRIVAAVQRHQRGEYHQFWRASGSMDGPRYSRIFDRVDAYERRIA